MKILFLTPRLPFPPNRGDRLRYFNFAKVLSKKHELSLISFIGSKKELDHIKGYQGIFKNIETIPLPKWRSFVNMVLNIFSGLPLQVSYYDSKEMHERVETFLKDNKYDVVYTFHLRMAPYAKHIKTAYKILDLTDAVSLFLRRMIRHVNLILRPILYKEYLDTRRYETEIIKYFDESWLISSQDKEAINAGSSGSKLFVVPNGIDYDYFTPNSSIEKENNILFVGYMGVESVKTVKYFIRNIFPAVKNAHPSAKFHIVGADPPPEILKLAKEDNIIVTGYVKDLRPYYNSASVLVAPMRFVAGVQNKILEAMSMEVPVVTSTMGNEGVDAVNGKNIFVEDDPNMFALRVVKLLENEDLRKKIAKNARFFVREKFSWNSVVERMDLIAKKLEK